MRHWPAQKLLKAKTSMWFLEKPVGQTAVKQSTSVIYNFRPFTTEVNPTWAKYITLGYLISFKQWAGAVALVQNINPAQPPKPGSVG